MARRVPPIAIFVILIAMLPAMDGVHVSADDAAPSREQLLAKARAANAKTRYFDAWPIYEKLLADHPEDLVLLAEVARGAANVLRLDRADALVETGLLKSKELEDPKAAKSIQKALRAVKSEVKRIRSQERNFVPQLVQAAIRDIHKHGRAIPKSKMKATQRSSFYVGYSMRDKYSGPHLWGTASEYLKRGNATIYLHEHHRDAALANKRFAAIIGLCNARRMHWEKLHRHRTKTFKPSLKTRDRGEDDKDLHPARKGVTYCWDNSSKGKANNTFVAIVNLGAPVNKETNKVDPDGIWTIVIMLDSGWFKGP